MKALSPVIATLILIAIAVIAGVFVLRQFLIFTTTTATQQYIEIQDAVLQVVHVNDTYADVYLQIKIKNVGDQLVTIDKVEVDGYTPTEVSKIQGVELRPGETFATSMKVRYINPTLDPDKAWETGTEHLVTVYYNTTTTTGQQVSLKVIAR